MKQSLNDEWHFTVIQFPESSDIFVSLTRFNLDAASLGVNVPYVVECQAVPWCCIFELGDDRH